MFITSLFTVVCGIFMCLADDVPDEDGRRYWETDINRDCGRVELGAKYQQIGAMQWGYPDSNGHLPYDYNTKVCLTPDAGHDCIKLSGAEDHKVNRFYLATGLYVAVYSDDDCRNDKVTIAGQSGTLFGEYKIRSYTAWRL